MLLLLGVLAVAGGALVASASTHLPTITQVMPSADYRTLTVVLDAAVHAAPASDPDKPLTASSFQLRDGTQVLAEVLVVEALSGTSYRLTVPEDVRVTPNVTHVVIPSGQAVDADGGPAGELSRVVPLTVAEAGGPLGALRTVQFDGESLGALPYVGGWFQNVKETKASTAPLAAMTAAVGVTAPAAGTAPTVPATATIAMRSVPRTLTDVMPGLAGALDAIAAKTTDTTATQAQVAAALEGVAGIGTATFTSTTLTLAFDSSESAGSMSSAQRTEIAELAYSATGTSTFDLHLSGSLTLPLDKGKDAGPSQLALTMEARQVVAPTAGTRIGMVAVTPTQSVTATGLGATLTCAAPCTAVPLPAATGTAVLALDAITYDDEGSGVTTVSLQTADKPLTATWDALAWDLAALKSRPTDKALLAALEPVLANHAAFRAADLHQFDRLNTRAVVLGMEWVATWLRSLEGVEGFGVELPGVGMTVGDVLALADQVGQDVSGLVAQLEGDGTGGVAADPTAQDLVRVLCDSGLMTCTKDAALKGLDITPDVVTYDVEMTVCQVLFGAAGTCDAPKGVPVTKAGPSLDLAAGDTLELSTGMGPLGGINATLRTGSWAGTATASLAFQLRLDLREDGDVMDDLPEGTEQYPGPGFPASDWLVPGDACRGLALGMLPGYSETSFAAANEVLVDGVPDQGKCDLLAWNAATKGLTSVSLPALGEVPASSRTVTAEEVCRGVALKHGVDLTDFLRLNPGLGGGDAQLDACAARAYAHVTAADDAARTALRAFVYYKAPDVQTLPLGHRLSIDALGDAPLADAKVELAGSGLGGDVQLGFLDLGLAGHVSATPTVSLRLAGADPLSLTQLAAAADAAAAESADEAPVPTVTGTTTPAPSLGELVEATLDGQLAIDLALSNSLAFPVKPATFRLQGQIDELLAGDGVQTTGDCSTLAAGDTGLCYSLGEWSDLGAMTPAQVLRMITGLLDRVAGATGAEEASFELPFVGVSMQDLVAFNRKVGEFADTVEARDPQTLTALKESIDAGLTSAGLPAGTVVVAIDDGVFTVQLPLGIEETASYPFSFDVGIGGPLPIRIAPADGGASVRAGAVATFAPTLGIDLDAPVSLPLDERVFLVVDEKTDPIISADLAARVTGDVTLGPLSTDFSGTVTGKPTATLQLSEMPVSGNRLTLGRLSELLGTDEDEDAAPAAAAEPVDRTATPEPPTPALSDFFSWGGVLTVEASIAGPLGPLELAWNGDLKRLITEPEYKGDFTRTPKWDLSGLKLDLETLVRGTSQTSRFVGRTLATSDALATSLPLVGDELAQMSEVGADLQEFATAVDDMWTTVKEEQGSFIAKVNKDLDSTVCTPLRVVGTCTVALKLFDEVGGPAQKPGKEDIGTAQQVELQLTIDKEETLTLESPKLLDVPGFELDTRADLEVRAGYRLGLTLGLNMQDGFYVKGFDVKDEDDPALSRLIEVYAAASLKLDRKALDGTVTDATETAADRRGLKVGGVTIFTLEEIDIALKGSLGPKDDAAGFALDMPAPLTLADIASGRRSIDSIFEPKISIAVASTTSTVEDPRTARIVIQTPDDIADEVPVMRFPVHFGWAVEGVIAKGLEVPSPTLSIGSRNAAERSYVAIDASGLMDGVVRPALQELNKYNPVAQAKPLRDALNTEIPVVEQNVRSMLDVALAGDTSWKLFGFLLDLDEVASSLEESTGPAVFAPLGGYQVLPAAESGFFMPTVNGTPMTSFWDLGELEPEDGGIKEIKLVKTLIGTLSGAAGGSTTFTPPAEPAPAPPAPGTSTGSTGTPPPATFSGTPPKRKAFGQIVSMPILDEPMSAATLLFGGDVEPVSFIEIAPPPVNFGLSVSFSRTLFDLDVGFLEAQLSVGLEGAVGAVLRVGVGYSSHGLTSGDPVNGLYLVDAYDGERDLPFIALGGRVSARVDGRFKVLNIAEATFSGSGYVRLEAGLDLYDESLTIPEGGRGDGKFHIDEMIRVVRGHRTVAGTASNPVRDAFCIFRPTVQLEAGLSFGGTARVAGINVWSGSWSQDWDLLDVDITCPLAPRLAHLDGRRLILNAGPYAGDRLDGATIANEGFTVVPWTDEKGTEGDKGADYLEVRGAAGLGATAIYEPMRFPVDAVEEIYVDLGAGDDTVDISTAITTPAKVYGGPGTDTLKGGGGDDLLDGGTGTDRIEARAGNDEIVVGSDGSGARDLKDLNGLGRCATGCNVVVLGSGDDTVRGGPSPVVYQTPDGAFGQDRIDHEGTSMVLDLGTSTAGFDGVVDGLGGRFTSREAGGGTVETGDPQSLVRVIGSQGSDRMRIVDGSIGMYVDGGRGADVLTVETNGDDRTVRTHDSGTDPKPGALPGAAPLPLQDKLVVRGTAGVDRFLLRARVKGSPIAGPERGPQAAVPADEGVVAVLSRESATAVSERLTEHPTKGKVDDPAPTSYRHTGEAASTQLVFYDSSFALLSVDGVAGADQYALDDVAAKTQVDGGRGAGSAGSDFQVGQIFGWQTDKIVDPDGTGPIASVRVPVSPLSPVGSAAARAWGDDQFRYRESIRGWLSYGISHETSVNGGDAADSFTVYSNRAKLTLNGGGGDNTFTLRAFIANGSITANGGDGDDTFNYDFEYVANNEVDINGGEGFNTYVAVGTELQDGFTATQDGVTVCTPSSSAPAVESLDARVTRASTLDEAALADLAPGAAPKGTPGVRALPLEPVAGATVGATGKCALNSSVESVQRYVLYGLQGNDVFWVKGTQTGTETYLIGGTDGSSYVLGNDGDLSQIDGTVEVVADLRNLSPNAEEALRAVDLDFPLPILLQGDVSYSPVDALIPADAVDKEAKHSAYVDGSSMDVDLTGVMTRDVAATATAGIRLDGLTDARPETFTLAERAAGGSARTYDVLGGIGMRGLDRLRVVLGNGDDELHVTGTHAAYAVPEQSGMPASKREGRTEISVGGGDDQLQADALEGPTWVWLDDGANTVRAGTGDASGLAAPLEVYGGLGSDDVEVDAGASTQLALRADLDLSRDRLRSWGNTVAKVDFLEVTGLEMPSLVRHDDAVEVLRVVTGPGADDVNVRGSLAGTTELRTGNAADRVFVSDVAPRTLGASTPPLLGGSLNDVEGDVDVDAGAEDNLLMISDRDSGKARVAELSAERFGVTGLGTVSYDATGGTFARGVTAWLGDQKDEVTVTGARAEDDDDPAVLAWEQPRTEPAGARTLTTLSTGAGDDWLEVAVPAGDGVLVVNLEEGDDRLLGGSSARGFVAFGGDGADRIESGAGDDLVFGDWGRVEYRDGPALVGVLGVPDRLDLVAGRALAPSLVETCTAQPTVVGGALDGCTPTVPPSLTAVRSDGPAAGVRNWLALGAGDDVALGGGGSDWLEAASGHNAFVADHGRVVRRLPAELGGARRVVTNNGFLDVAVLEQPFVYDVDLHDDLGGGGDAVLGGDQRDAVFAGVGDDLVNAGDGSDLVFGGDGHDTLWGGHGDDRVYAGFGDDLVDLKLMPVAAGGKKGTAVTRDGWPIGAWWPGKPLVGTAGWKALAPLGDTDLLASNDNGSDLAFGGEGADVLQADVGGAGPVPGDRLVDWYGGYNVYFVCSGAYGAGYVVRVPSPSTVSALQELARADGAAGTAGVRQLAIPVDGNRSPTHPAHPGNNHGC